ncbi:MAG: hypothetical protein NTW86_01200 [Candidatus Sumerlaeota bacterium]|nr:hypothetical protein [Candidatus Sumerlaeota bacterium]
MSSASFLSRRLTQIAAILAVLSSAAACSSSHIHQLTDYRYPPKPEDVRVEAFIGDVARPYEKIAIIQSTTASSKDDETKARQLEELKGIARRLGADAVQWVRVLSTSGSGMISDPATPFPAVKQGEFTKFFLRGEAIKYIEPVSISASPTERNFSPAE